VGLLLDDPLRDLQDALLVLLRRLSEKSLRLLDCAVWLPINSPVAKAICDWSSAFRWASSTTALAAAYSGDRLTAIATCAARTAAMASALSSNGRVRL
jgi:hypothetical protein